MLANTRVTGGNGATKQTVWVFGLSLGATGLSTCPRKSFARSMSGGDLVANDSIFSVNVDAELKSYTRLGIDLGAVGTATTSPTRRDKPWHGTVTC